MIGRLLLVISIPFALATVGVFIAEYFAFCIDMADRRKNEQKKGGL